MNNYFTRLFLILSVNSNSKDTDINHKKPKDQGVVSNLDRDNQDFKIKEEDLDYMKKYNSNFSKKELEERYLFLQGMKRIIIDSEIYNKIKIKFENLKKEEEYYNILLIVELVKNQLLEEKYRNKLDIEKDLELHNKSLKLHFSFKVIKIKTNGSSDLEAIKEFIKYQQNNDFDGDQYKKKLEIFFEKFDKTIEYIPYNEMEYIPNVAHVSLPKEYREGESFMKNYNYFIFGRKPLEDGNYEYYIVDSLKENLEESLDEFISKKKEEMFYKWIKTRLKKSKILINGMTIIDFLDEKNAYAVFKH